MEEYKWIEMSESIVFKKADTPKCYGPVRRGNKTFYRNYGRELKTKNALSAVDIINLKIKQAQEMIEKSCGINEYMIGGHDARLSMTASEKRYGVVDWSQNT